jgi:hypothetical protein
MDRREEVTYGEQAGAWGTTTNNNFDIIDRLINGVGSISLSGTTHTLTTSDGSLSDGMFKVLVLGGSPSGTNTITIEPNNADKLYFVKNASGQSVTFTQGSGSDVTILNGFGAIIFADGAGSGAAVTDLTALFTTSQAIDNVVIGGTTPAAITGTTITATTSILPDASGGADIGSTSAEFGDIYIADDKKIKFGSDQDVSIEYDEDGTDSLLISGGDVTLSDDKKLFFGTDKDVSIEYDEDGTDTLLISGGDITIADDKKLNFGTDKDVSIEYDEDGNNTMLVTGDVVFADGTTDVDIASHDTSNGLKLGGTLVTATAEEINKLDGVTRTTSQINSARDGTVTSVATGNGLTGGTITGSGTVSMANSWITNSATLHDTGTVSTYTNSTGYPVFISGRSTSTGSRTFTVTINGVGKTLDMVDGDSGTYDDLATVLPNGASVAVDSGSFTYMAVQMRPG